MSSVVSSGPWTTGLRTRSPCLGFNLGCLPLSIGVAGHAYRALGGESASTLVDNVVPLLVAESIGLAQRGP